MMNDLHVPMIDLFEQYRTAAAPAFVRTAVFLRDGGELDFYAASRWGRLTGAKFFCFLTGQR